MKESDSAWSQCEPDQQGKSNFICTKIRNKIWPWPVVYLRLTLPRTLAFRRLLQANYVLDSFQYIVLSKMYMNYLVSVLIHITEACTCMKALLQGEVCVDPNARNLRSEVVRS